MQDQNPAWRVRGSEAKSTARKGPESRLEGEGTVRPSPPPCRDQNPAWRMRGSEAKSTAAKGPESHQGSPLRPTQT